MGSKLELEKQELKKPHLKWTM